MPRIRAVTNWADRKAGDEWDVGDIEARMLCAADLPGGQKAEYVDRAMRPIETPAALQIKDAPPEKRRYMRRDMRAQE